MVWADSIPEAMVCFLNSLNIMSLLGLLHCTCNPNLTQVKQESDTSSGSWAKNSNLELRDSVEQQVMGIVRLSNQLSLSSNR